MTRIAVLIESCDTLPLLVDDPSDEHQIVIGLVNGDADLTTIFVQRYEPRVRRAVIDAGVPATDADDVTQEILIEAIRQLSRGAFQHRSSLRTWMRHVTEGRIVDYWRASSRRGRGKTVPFEELPTSTSSLLAPPGQDARILAEEALTSMPPRHRIALVAHFRAGVNVEDLAKLLGVSVERTRGILTEAKALFRKGVCGREETRAPKRLDR